MGLSVMRRHSKVILWIIILAMTASLALLGVTARVSGRKAHAGVLFGREVSLREFDSAVRRWSLTVFTRLRDREALEAQVWSRLVLVEAARREGLVVPDEQVHGQLVEQFKGNLSREAYAEMVARIGLSEEEYEQWLREALLLARLQDLVTSSVEATSDEARRRYLAEQEKATIKYVRIDWDDFRAPDEVTEEEMKVYYDEHRDRYSRQERVVIEYIAAPFADFMEQAEAAVTDEEIAAYYEEHRQEYRKETTPPAEGEDEATPETDDETVVAYRPLEEVAGEIRTELTEDGARKLAIARLKEAKEKIYDDSADRPGFEAPAKTYGLRHGRYGPLEVMDIFRDEKLKGLTFLYEAFRSEIDDIRLHEGGEKAAHLYRVVERLEPDIAPYDEVTGKVKEDTATEKARLAASEAAEALLEEARSKGLETAVKEADLSVILPPPFVRGKYSNGRYASQVKDLPGTAVGVAAFQATPGELVGPLEVIGAVEDERVETTVIFNLIERTPGEMDEAAFAAAKSNLLEAIRTEKRRDVWVSYVASREVECDFRLPVLRAEAKQREEKERQREDNG